MKAVVAMTVLAVALSALDCHKYQDADDAHTETGKCFVTDSTNKIIYVSTCPKTQFCDESDGNCKDLQVVNELFPGQECAADNNCLSGNCTNSTDPMTCAGKGDGESCDETNECNVGLYCGLKDPSLEGNNVDADEKYCKALKKEKEACGENSECQQDLACIDGNCRMWFSGADGAACELEDDKFSFSCTSGQYCKKYANGTQECQPNAPTRKVEKCTANTDCTTSDTDITGTCACAITKDSGSYCSPQPGDDAVKLAQTYYIDYVSQFSLVALKCHSEIRFDAACWEEFADAEVYLGFQIAELQRHLALDPDFGGQPYTAFGETVLEALKPKDAAYLEDTVYEGTCDSYTVVTDMKNSTCLTHDAAAHTVKVQPCELNDKKSYCQPSVKDSVTCAEPPHEARWPGFEHDHCLEDKDCLSSKCKSHSCTGLEKDEACEGRQDFGCAIGLACLPKADIPNEKNFTCQDARAEGKDCEEDVDCVNGHECANNKCAKEYSVKVSETTSSDCSKDYTSNVCESGQCVMKDASVLVCLDAFKSKGSVPIKTNKFVDCVGPSTTSDYTQYYDFKHISCNYGSTGASYCKANLGDAVGAAYIAARKQVVGLDQGKCHYLRQLDPYCWHDYSSHHDKSLNWTLYADYHDKMSQYTLYPALAGKDFAANETAQVFFSDYWNVQYNPHYFDVHDHDEGAAVLQVLLALLLLFI